MLVILFSILKFVSYLFAFVMFLFLINPKWGNENKRSNQKELTRKDACIGVVFLLIVASVFSSLSRSPNDEEKPLENVKPKQQLIEANIPENADVEPGMVKYDTESGKWFQGSMADLKNILLTKNNFKETVSPLLNPGTLEHLIVEDFQAWNEAYQYKTRYDKYHAVELNVIISSPDTNLVKRISYEFYKALYYINKDFRIAQVFLRFEVKDSYKTAQMTLGENGVEEYFSQGEGDAEDFYLWVNDNITSESEEYAEDVVWVNVGW